MKFTEVQIAASISLDASLRWRDSEQIKGWKNKNAYRLSR